VGLVFFGFLIGRGNLGHLTRGKAFTFDLGGWKTIGLSLMWIMFAYSGWNASAYIGSEIKNPVKNLPRSLMLGTGIVLLLYLCLNLFYVYAVPPPEMEGVISIGGAAAANLFGKSFESVLSILISFALFSSLSAYIILGPRVYYSMAKDRYFFRFAAEVHPKHGVPSKSIYLQGIIAVFMVTLGTFDQILTYMGFSLGLFPILAVFGVFKLRKRQKNGSLANSYRMPGFPFVPIFYMLTAAIILFLSFFERPVESSIAILMVIVGIPVFFLFAKKHNKKF
jgi:APA family basic amino acid/polyamine antiporter